MKILYFDVCVKFLYGIQKVPREMPHHDDVIKWKHFPRYWPFVQGIHRSPVNSTHKGQWRGALMFALICARINGWVNNREAGDLRRHQAHCDIIVMKYLAHTKMFHYYIWVSSFLHYYWIDENLDLPQLPMQTCDYLLRRRDLGSSRLWGYRFSNMIFIIKMPPILWPNMAWEFVWDTSNVSHGKWMYCFINSTWFN